MIFLDTLNKIFYLLKKNGLSDAEFARQLKISKSVISDWKKGRNKSYNKRLNKIAEILNVSVEYLSCSSDDLTNIPNILHTNTNGSTVISEKIILNDDEQKLIDNYRKLDDEGKINVKHTAYYELRRMKQDGDRETNKLFKSNN